MQEILSNKLNAYRVLYAEDEDGIRENIKEILEHYFKETYTAKNANDAYLKYVQNKPDLIITDIQMGNENGLDLIRRIRESDSKTRIIITD